MPRPVKERKVSFRPGTTFFKPRGIPLVCLKTIILEKDELEAIRLADGENLYHKEAARLMGVSRQTFGNILKSGRKKISQALTQGHAIQLKTDSPPPRSTT